MAWRSLRRDKLGVNEILMPASRYRMARFLVYDSKLGRHRQNHCPGRSCIAQRQTRRYSLQRLQGSVWGLRPAARAWALPFPQQLTRLRQALTSPNTFFFLFLFPHEFSISKFLHLFSSFTIQQPTNNHSCSCLVARSRSWH